MDHVLRNKGSTRSLNQVLHAIKHGRPQDQPWLTESDSTQLRTLIKELQYEDMTPGRQKRPLLRRHLLRAVQVLNPQKGLALLETLLLFTGHNGLLRIGKLLSGLVVSDVFWDCDHLGFQLFLGCTKTVRKGPGAYVSFRHHGSLSAVSLMTKWFDENDLWHAYSSHIFPSCRRGVFDFSRTMSPDYLRKIIGRWVSAIGLVDPSKYSGHSMRAGGATDLFTMRVPYYIIKKMGRWLSDAALVYFRDDEDVILTVASAFGGCH